MNTLLTTPAASTNTKPLWAAVAVLGVAVLAMGATLIRTQNPPTEPRMAVLPVTSASAPGSVYPTATLGESTAARTASLTQATQTTPPLQPNTPVRATHTTTTSHQSSVPNRPLAPVKHAQAATNNAATEVFEPSANPRVVQPRNAEPAVAHAPEPVRVICLDCGTVESFTPVDVEGVGSGTGAIAGGVLGAVVGNQVGDGNGKVLATILGAVGGGMAGNSVEKKMKKVTHYEVSVRMEDGSHRTIRQTIPAVVGSQVRVQGDSLLAR